MSILTDKVGINVLLEGVDGAGKSTVANLLVEIIYGVIDPRIKAAQQD